MSELKKQFRCIEQSDNIVVWPGENDAFVSYAMSIMVADGTEEIAAASENRAIVLIPPQESVILSDIYEKLSWGAPHPVRDGKTPYFLRVFTQDKEGKSLNTHKFEDPKVFGPVENGTKNGMKPLAKTPPVVRPNGPTAGGTAPTAAPAVPKQAPTLEVEELTSRIDVLEEDLKYVEVSHATKSVRPSLPLLRKMTGGVADIGGIITRMASKFPEDMRLKGLAARLDTIGARVERMYAVRREMAPVLNAPVAAPTTAPVEQLPKVQPPVKADDKTETRLKDHDEKLAGVQAGMIPQMAQDVQEVKRSLAGKASIVDIKDTFNELKQGFGTAFERLESSIKDHKHSNQPQGGGSGSQTPASVPTPAKQPKNRSKQFNWFMVLALVLGILALVAMFFYAMRTADIGDAKATAAAAQMKAALQNAELNAMKQAETAKEWKRCDAPNPPPMPPPCPVLVAPPFIGGNVENSIIIVGSSNVTIGTIGESCVRTQVCAEPPPVPKPTAWVQPAPTGPSPWASQPQVAPYVPPQPEQAAPQSAPQVSVVVPAPAMYGYGYTYPCYGGYGYGYGCGPSFRANIGVCGPYGHYGHGGYRGGSGFHGGGGYGGHRR